MNTVERARTTSWIMLLVLSVAYVFSLLDRIILSLLVEPIKADLDLTDTQIGLLQGFAFSLLYSVSAVPLGMIIDRTRRLSVVGIGVAVWSAATSACGAAANFVQLVVFRSVVGLGEATLNPSAYSLIADAFPKRRVGFAMGVFALGASVGGGVSLIIGAAVIAWVASAGAIELPVIGEVRAWQAVFFVVGTPGLLIAAAAAVLPEPPRLQASPEDGGSGKPNVVLFYTRNARWIFPHHVAYALAAMVLYGTTSWIIAFFARVYGLGPSQAGLLLGAANIVGAVIGLLGGGALSDHFGARQPHRRLIICAISMFGSMLAATSFPLVASPFLSAALWGGVMLFAGLPIGVANAALQHRCPSHLRGQAAAVAGLFAGLLGIGLGPLFIGMLTDGVFTADGGLRYSIAIVGFGASLLSALTFILAGMQSKRQPIDDAQSPGGITP